MKDLITAVASLMLLLIFVLQFAGNQNLHTRMFRADMAIENFRDTAGLQGYISDEILVEAEDSRQPKPEGTLLHYRIGYPLKKLIAAAAMLGISAEENRVWMEEDGWVVSRFYISKETAKPEEESEG